MATYAIGDLQGCHDQLLSLLAHIGYQPGTDRLWFTGDLVNRGPRSLETLRFVRDLGDDTVSVLGNHDLHLLALAYLNSPHKKRDTLQPILDAPDRDELLNWLRHRPLLHHDSGNGYTLIHAGLPPHWDLSAAQSHAAELEAILRGPRYAEFFRHMYGDKPNLWSDALTGWDRARYITNCFTRLRYCAADGRLALNQKGAPDTVDGNYFPWFQMPGRANANMKIIFGHWSTLGAVAENGVYALDTGCIWGGQLTAINLERPAELLQVPCPQVQAPHLKL